MSRLLHAAARGARIQVMIDFNEWYDHNNPTIRGICDYPASHRIHPDDEALQYGPISTALREMAILPAPSFDGIELPHGYFSCLQNYWYQYGECTEELTRSLFLLILAESLADIGL
jgi:hypothetical protein